MPASVKEVRYHYLRPRQAVARRRKRPLAWLPLGVLEWHGPQNPLGLDAMKAKAVCCEAARRIGGLVMPALYWGDHRRALAEVVFDPAVSPWYPQDKPDQTLAIARLMQWPKERLVREADRMDRAGGWRLYTELLVNILFQIESLGFRRIAAYAGHAPLRKPLEQAARTFRRGGGKAKVVFLDFPGGEDHAAKRETSLMLALFPGLADLRELAPSVRELSPSGRSARPQRTPRAAKRGERHVGMLGEDPLNASAAFGRKMVREFVAAARKRLEL